MIIPALMFINFLYLVKKPITSLLLVAERIANTSKGNPIPIPKNTKLSKFVVKLITEVDTANRTANEAGLQGRTIAPKNNPKINADKVGFFKTGAVVFGKNLPRSKLKIRKMLTTAKIPKAIGEMIPIAFVNDA